MGNQDPQLNRSGWQKVGEFWSSRIMAVRKQCSITALFYFVRPVLCVLVGVLDVVGIGMASLIHLVIGIYIISIFSFVYTHSELTLKKANPLLRPLC